MPDALLYLFTRLIIPGIILILGLLLVFTANRRVST